MRGLRSFARSYNWLARTLYGERKIAMKTLFGLAPVVLFVLVAARSGTAQTAQPRPATHRTTLRQDTEIQGYPCAKGYAFLYADGRLEQCGISREIAYGEAKLPVGSLVVLLQDGRPKYAMLQHDSEVAGVKCSGGNWLLGPSEGPDDGVLSQREAGAVLAGRRPERSGGPMYDRGIHRIIRRRCAA